MSRRAFLALFVLLLPAAAGCGGSPSTSAPRAPRLPHGLALEWARRADAISAAVAAGEGCRARQLATALRTDVAAGDAAVPARLRPVLVTAVGSLTDRISCVPPPQPKTKPPHGPKPKPPHGHDQGHGHGHGDGGQG